MTDRKKVIKGLENCIAGCDCPPECPYLDDCNDLMKPMFVELAKDALALLKEQEPRVLTLYEVRTAEDCMEPVFLEMNAERETPDVFSWRTVKHIVPLNDEDIYVLDNVGFSSALYSEYYGITWRCWNIKPTEEQRKTVKWDD